MLSPVIPNAMSITPSALKQSPVEAQNGGFPAIFIAAASEGDMMPAAVPANVTIISPAGPGEAAAIVVGNGGKLGGKTLPDRQPHADETADDGPAPAEDASSGEIPAQEATDLFSSLTTVSVHEFAAPTVQPQPHGTPEIKGPTEAGATSTPATSPPTSSDNPRQLVNAAPRLPIADADAPAPAIQPSTRDTTASAADQFRPGKVSLSEARPAGPASILRPAVPSSPTRPSPGQPSARPAGHTASPAAGVAGERPAPAANRTSTPQSSPGSQPTLMATPGATTPHTPATGLIDAVTSGTIRLASNPERAIQPDHRQASPSAAPVPQSPAISSPAAPHRTSSAEAPAAPMPAVPAPAVDETTETRTTITTTSATPRDEAAPASRGPDLPATAQRRETGASPNDQAPAEAATGNREPQMKPEARQATPTPTQQTRTSREPAAPQAANAVIEPAGSEPAAADKASLSSTPQQPITLASDLKHAVMSQPAPAQRITAEGQTPQDFATLVDRLVEARDAANPQVVRAALSHSEFGTISLQFRNDDANLKVTMASADPAFAPAAQAAAAQAAASGEQPGNPPRQDQQPGQQQQQSQNQSPQQTSTGSGDSAQQGRASADGNGREGRAGHEQAARERQGNEASARAGTAASSRRGGIFA